MISKGIICLCGSTKFKDMFEIVNRELTLEGWVVLAPGVFGHVENYAVMGKRIGENKEALDKLHKEKIDISDCVMVLDVDGYIGTSTRTEIEHAIANRKKVYFLSMIKEYVQFKDLQIDK